MFSYNHNFLVFDLEKDSGFQNYETCYYGAECYFWLYNDDDYENGSGLSTLDRWVKMGVLATEMESAALFVVAAALGVRCGSCFHAVWNQEREKAGLFMEMTEDTSGAIKVGIEAMKRIIAADKAKK